ncbi:unnamed protein product [Meganyctiphanes norvegica]|uniref:Mitochondrial basic amino acids transporter n=1 Tax=Meganyctiphanes norvegica TaxID=48144 RepID=A0AAV2S966_MEGNR
MRGMYKGMSSPMAGVAAINGIVFGVHGSIISRVSDPDSLRTHFFSGAAAGLCQGFVSSPMELLKTRMQVQTEVAKPMVQSLSTAAHSSSTVANSTSYNSPMDCLRKIVTTEGTRGLFRGQAITLMRDVPGFASYFISYEWMVRTFGGCEEEASTLVILGAGGMAGVVSWVLTYPIDFVKSRIQADGVGGINQYKGIIHCLQKSVAEDGWGCLTKGLNSAIIRAFPTNAATFVVVSWTLKLLGNNEPMEENDDLHEVIVKGKGDKLVYAMESPEPLNQTKPFNQPSYPSLNIDYSSYTSFYANYAEDTILERSKKFMKPINNAMRQCSQCGSQNEEKGEEYITYGMGTGCHCEDTWVVRQEKLTEICSSMRSIHFDRDHQNLSNSL